MQQARPKLAVIGQVPRTFREYALREASMIASVILITNVAEDWHHKYCDEVIVADLDSPRAHKAIDEMIRGRIAGVYTLDERYVELTARLVGTLDLPGSRAKSISRLKDKGALRELTRHRDYSLEFGIAESLGEALKVAARIGYPVVVKPRALGGSVGVIHVADPGDMRFAFDLASEAKVGNLRSAYTGVLIEEFASGPGISVNSFVHGGRTTMCFASDRLVGLAPYFEELGHNVGPIAEDLRGLVGAIAEDIHLLSEFDCGVSNIEFVLTEGGPKLIEVNARLSGDLIPYLGFKATGINLARIAAMLALGDAPPRTRPGGGSAAIRFIYPPRELVFGAIEWPSIADAAGALDIRVSDIAGTGARVAPPPQSFMSRLGYAIVTGQDKGPVVAAADHLASEAVVREINA